LPRRDAFNLSILSPGARSCPFSTWPRTRSAISRSRWRYVAGLFDLTPAHVHEVVTFYTMFFREPKGRHVVSVCHNLSCHLMGAKTIIDHLKQRLGIGNRRPRRMDG
jgi:NADH:ubiquinone oxidoreductase subunit E